MLPHGAENAKIRVSEVKMVPALLDALPERGGWVMGEDRNTIATTGGPIRVLLADDHTMFRQGLARILASYGGVEVVADLPNDEEALRLARELSPDVVIMQVQIPFGRAVATLEALRALPDPPKVVVLTMFESPRYVRDLTGAGASAYLVKTSSAEHLVAAVRAAVFDPQGKNTVVGMSPAMLEESPDGVDGMLSARELELLLLAARGLSNRQIASSAHLAEATVKRHLANVFQKMGVSSRGEAARKALQEEWITIERSLSPILGSPAHRPLRTSPRLARDQDLGLVHEREEVLHARVLYLVGSAAWTCVGSVDCFRLRTVCGKEIGWQLFALGKVQSYWTVSLLLLDTYATRLLAQPLTQSHDH